MMKVLCVGHIAYDIALSLEDYPLENTRNKVVAVNESGGGCSATAACLLGKWGEQSYICGVVGYDAYSDKIKKEFNEFKVKTDYLETNYETKTALTYILLNKKRATRTILSQESKLPPLKKTDYNIAADMIMLDGHEYEASLNILKNMPNALSMIDAGRVNKHVLDLCTKVNFIVCSKEFAEEVSGIKYTDNASLSKIYLNLKSRFAKQEIVITLEDKGAIYSFENQIKLLPALKVTVADSTGAGDIFHGAFCYQYLKTRNIENAVKFANIAAGLSLSKVGTKNSIPQLSEVEKYYAQV